MQSAPGGFVMNENTETLPRGCAGIAGDVEFTVRAGREYAGGEPGVIFGMDRRTIEVEPCSRVTIRFVNEDDIRHQWMIHGLPRYLYPGGMFHIEAMGGHSQSGTFIAPAGDRTYLVHCDMSQHMEKGMRGQLVVGRGSGDLWGVPGVSDAFRRSSYLPGNAAWIILAAVLLPLVVLAVQSRFPRR